MISRRGFIRNGVLLGAGAPMWLRLSGRQALAQAATANGYKAIVCIELQGGNDGNNMLVPYSGPEYAQYQALRGPIAYAQSSLNPLNNGIYGYPLAVHPGLPNVAKMFNSGSASFVANVGPLKALATKAQIQANPALLPAALMDHTVGIVQWQSATSVLAPDSGWGGRIADALIGQSGTLPMVLNAGETNIFTTGHTVQGITVQGGTAPSMAAIPVSLQTAQLTLATQDSSSSNHLVAQAAQLRASSLQQQLLLAQAQSAGSTLKTQFPTSIFGGTLNTIAKLINGRSVIGASRQIFYCSQGNYDTHQDQLANQFSCLSELDLGLAAFMQALQEMGLSDQVLICTQSDFNRSMQANGSGGTDHAWGNHQIIIGGGIKGGRIIGTMPDFDLGGSQDIGGNGVWIPTLAVTQMAAAVGSWMGVPGAQINTVFPELVNFTQGAISLS